MTFSDLMSSSRGPGVIGTLMALLVLVGFGALFIFAFDEELQGGGQTIESLLRNQAKEISSLNSAIARREAEAHALSNRKKIAIELREATSENRLREGTIDGLQDWLGKLKLEIADQEKQFADYKDEYRAYARKRAKGETIAALKTRDGMTYHDVRIKQVTAIGMDVSHRDGNKRISFENLPDEIRDRFQHDPAQMEMAKLEEAKQRAEHDAAAAKANMLADAKLAEMRQRDLAEQQAKRQAAIQAKEARILTLSNEIKMLEADIRSAQAQANAARSAGRMFIDRSSSLRGKIRQKFNEQARLRGEISALRSSQ